MTQYMLSVHHDPADAERMAAMTPEETQTVFEALEWARRGALACQGDVEVRPFQDE